MKKVLLLLVASYSAACSKDPPPAAPQTSASTMPATSASALPPGLGGDALEGKPSPDFSVTASSGTKLSLSELKGKWVVVYFYPKDETPGCTTEACAFRDAFDALSKKAVLIGVSADSD